MFQQGRHLLQRSDLIALLQLPEDKVQHVIDTQLTPLVLCGEERFDSRELDELINTYRQISERKRDHAQ